MLLFQIESSNLLMMTSTNWNISANWSFVRGIHRSPVNSPHKGQWRGALMFSLIYAGTNGWVNNPAAGDLRRHSAHYDITVMLHLKLLASSEVLQPWCFIFRCQDYICITPGPYNIWELGAPSAVAVGELARGGWGGGWRLLHNHGWPSTCMQVRFSLRCLSSCKGYIKFL